MLVSLIPAYCISLHISWPVKPLGDSAFAGAYAWATAFISTDNSSLLLMAGSTSSIFSDKDLVLDPMGHLRSLFSAGKMDEVESEAKRMVSDPKYRYVNFEQKINQAGYDLMNSKQMEQALYVFGLNTKLYPKSANVWDSFAEANWKANKIEKAVEYYNKAIELDPNGVTGDNSRRMLSEIKKAKPF